MTGSIDAAIVTCQSVITANQLSYYPITMTSVIYQTAPTANERGALILFVTK